MSGVLRLQEYLVIILQLLNLDKFLQTVTRMMTRSPELDIQMCHVPRQVLN